MGSYFDLDDILSEEQRVPTTFLVPAAQLGHFMPGSEVRQIDDLPKDTRLELPLWLSKNLVSKNMVRVDTPIFYGSRSRSRLKADAWSINIRDKCPYYYHVGKVLSQVCSKLWMSVCVCVCERERERERVCVCV